MPERLTASSYAPDVAGLNFVSFASDRVAAHIGSTKPKGRSARRKVTIVVGKIFGVMLKTSWLGIDHMHEFIASETLF